MLVKQLVKISSKKCLRKLLSGGNHLKISVDLQFSDTVELIFHVPMAYMIKVQSGI